MPSLPSSPCQWPGCAAQAVDRGWCPRHRRALRVKNRQSVYGTAQHKRWRVMVLARNPLCCACHKEASQHADHVVPLHDGGTWALTNGQGLCHSCHSVKTAEDRRKRKAIEGELRASGRKDVPPQGENHPPTPIQFGRPTRRHRTGPSERISTEMIQ